MSAVAPRHLSSSERGVGRGAELLQTLAETCAAQAQPLTAAFLHRSLASYLDCTPSAGATVEALARQGGIAPHTMAHDHYAYRTLGLPGLGISSLAAVLNELGYTLQEEGLLFPAKKLTASWFAHKPGMHGHGGGARGAHPMPRIFVSEIKVDQLSPASQVIIRKYVDGLRLGPAQVAVACTTGQVPWGRMERHEYETLLKESDYAAWVMVHGYALNHTALAVHRMRSEAGGVLGLDNASKMTAAHGLTMNDDGGVIKVSGDGLLRQCSSMSDMVPCGFLGSSGQVPGSYLELVERAPLPQYAGMQELEECHRRDGFEIANAAHLFTSTRA